MMSTIQLQSQVNLSNNSIVTMQTLASPGENGNNTSGMSGGMVNNDLSPESHLSDPTSPQAQPELATMTNVNVLDLHKDLNDRKIYDKVNNQVYVYGTTGGPVPNGGEEIVVGHRLSENNIKMEEQMIPQGIPTSAIIERNQLIDNRIIVDGRTGIPHQIAKIEMDNDQIYQVVGINGEQQQIISREVINGEHHILTRNEKGEHIFTRIVSDPNKLQQTENVIFTTTTNGGVIEQHKIMTNSGQVYTTDANHIATTMMEYTGQKDQVQHIYTTANGTGGGDNKAKESHIIYTHGDEEYAETVVKQEPTIYTTIPASDDKVLYDKSQIDLIYEDGNKTIIYAADPKGLELYSGSDLGIVGEGQVIVGQGGIQYTAQQIGGQTVFVVSSEHIDGELLQQ